MILIIEIALFLILAMAGYGYLISTNYGFSLNRIYFHHCIPKNIKQVIYIGSVLIAGVGLLISLNCFYGFDPLTQHLKSVCLVTMLFPIAVMDYKKHIIPNKILLVGLGLRVVIYVFELIQNFSGFLDIIKFDIFGALAIGGFFLICMLISKNSIGMGDVKLFTLMGLYQGLWGAFGSVFYSLIVSFFFAVGLLITRKKGRKDSIAFAPCILIGTYFAIFMSGM